MMLCNSLQEIPLGPATSLLELCLPVLDLDDLVLTAWTPRKCPLCDGRGVPSATGLRDLCQVHQGPSKQQYTCLWLQWHEQRLYWGVLAIWCWGPGGECWYTCPWGGETLSRGEGGERRVHHGIGWCEDPSPLQLTLGNTWCGCRVGGRTEWTKKLQQHHRQERKEWHQVLAGRIAEVDETLQAGNGRAFVVR